MASWGGIGPRLGAVLPGTRGRRKQIALFAQEWNRRNDLVDEALPLWVVLGDSTAQAIGASTIATGYVGGVRSRLSERDGVAWQVLNLSQAGAGVLDVTAEQLPRLEMVPRPDLVSCAVGANDLLRRTPALETGFETLIEALPPRTLVANLPRGLRQRQASALNERISALVARHGHRLVDLWAVTGPPWRGRFAADHFHPNDLGYESWTAAFTAAASAKT